MNRTILQREKVLVFRLFEVLGRPTGIPEGLKKRKIPKGRGVIDFGIRRARGE